MSRGHSLPQLCPGGIAFPQLCPGRHSLPQPRPGRHSLPPAMSGDIGHSPYGGYPLLENTYENGLKLKKLEILVFNLFDKMNKNHENT